MAGLIGSFIPCAKWTDDCQGKKDFDGRLVSISTRYWPSNYSKDGRRSANASIVINHGEPDQYGFADYLTIAEQDFNGETEEEVKRQVERWVNERLQEIAGLLMSHYKGVQ